jgi:hypothetical protein
MISLAAVSISWAAAPAQTVPTGTLSLTCDLRGMEEGEIAACQVFIDRIPQTATVPGGEKGTFSLTTGTHAVDVTVVGEDAHLWGYAAQSLSTTISAGTTRSLTTRFNRAGLLTITLGQPGVKGDILVDNQVVGVAVNSVAVWLPGDKRYTVRATNFLDPATSAIYGWVDVTRTAYVRQGQDSGLTLPMRQDYIAGYLEFTCNLPGINPLDIVSCTVYVDNRLLGSVASGRTATFIAPVGTKEYRVLLEGTDVNRWKFPYVQKQTIRGDKTTVWNAVIPLNPSSGSLYTGHFYNIGPHLRDTYNKGRQLGRSPNRFSKVGDSESYAYEFLTDIDDNVYDLGNFVHLSPVIRQYKGSFEHFGQAVQDGYVAALVLDPFWADPGVCKAGESPLACEIRTYNPSILLILIRTYEANPGVGSAYYHQLREIVKTSLDMGVIPVLSTSPYWGPYNPDEKILNEAIRAVANEFNVPLWDLHATTEWLPYRGVDGANTYHTTKPYDGRHTYFTYDDNKHMEFGMVRRNLEALEILHAIMGAVNTP